MLKMLAESALKKAFFSYGSGIPKRTPYTTQDYYTTILQNKEGIYT